MHARCRLGTAALRLLPQAEPVFHQLFVDILGSAPYELVQFGPVFSAVILNLRVEQFVEQDVVAQFVSQRCEVDIEVYVVGLGAAAPSCLLILDEDFFVFEAVLFG